MNNAYMTLGWICFIHIQLIGRIALTFGARLFILKTYLAGIPAEIALAGKNTLTTLIAK
jgi:hypothetical protein